MKYYVYELVDPRTGRAFYIGKGCGNRIDKHFHAPSLRVESVKNAVIWHIHQAGLRVEVRKVGLFANEADAFDFEAELICSAPNASLCQNQGRHYKRYEHLRPDPTDYSMELRIQ